MQDVLAWNECDIILLCDIILPVSICLLLQGTINQLLILMIVMSILATPLQDQMFACTLYLFVCCKCCDFTNWCVSTKWCDIRTRNDSSGAFSQQFIYFQTLNGEVDPLCIQDPWIILQNIDWGEIRGEISWFEAKNLCNNPTIAPVLPFLINVYFPFM